MRVFTMAVRSAVLLLLAMSFVVHLQADRLQGIRQGAQEFVREFYNWYTPKALQDNPGPALLFVALKYRSSSFAPGLLQQISDSRARAAREREPFLDFDPILNSQDPGERYEVGNATRKGDRYWVEVFCVCAGKKRVKPDVVAELVSRNGRWLFANFHYPNSEDPDSENLLAILRYHRRDRQEHPQ
jgi:hypothetical protein